MKKALERIIYIISGTLWLALVTPASAATPIFSNTNTDSHVRFNPGTNEVGDGIVLAGTDRNLMTFSFEYWGTSTYINTNLFTGNVQAKVRFYENNGPLSSGYASPSDNFFESPWFSINPTPRSTLVFSAGLDWSIGGLAIPVETNMTWTVEFAGMSLGDSVGVDIYSPPTVGQDYPDYWQYNGSSWMLMTNDVPMNFAAQMDAVPEPSSMVFSLLGGVTLLLAAGRLRRTA